MNFRRLLCLFNRHTPNRNRTKWSGHFYVSTCTACGEPIHRIGKQKWRKAKPELSRKM